MTLEELDATLPNGFHDSYVSVVTIDYVDRKATMDVEVWVGNTASPHEAEREKWRPGRLELSGLVFCTIDPPVSSYDYAKPAPLWIDLCPSDALRTDHLNLPQSVPEGAFVSHLFVSQWNAYIHVAALEASLTWLDKQSQ